jgi:hypothetical protein
MVKIHQLKGQNLWLRIIGSIALVCAVVGLSSLSDAEQSKAASSTDDFIGPLPGTWFAIGSNGEMFIPGGKGTLPNEDEAPSDSVTVLLLDFFACTACYVTHDENYEIVSYDFHWDGKPKPISLQCGAERTSGYHHIVFEHQKDWRQRIAQIPEANTDTWEDFMWYSVQIGLDSPANSRGPYDGKLCVSTIVKLYDHEGHYVTTFNPTSIVSLTNERVITSYPSTNSGC